MDDGTAVENEVGDDASTGMVSGGAVGRGQPWRTDADVDVTIMRRKEAKLSFILRSWDLVFMQCICVRVVRVDDTQLWLETVWKIHNGYRRFGGRLQSMRNKLRLKLIDRICFYERNTNR